MELEGTLHHAGSFPHSHDPSRNLGPMRNESVLPSKNATRTERSRHF